MKKIKAYRFEMSGQPSSVHPVTVFAATEGEAVTLFMDWYVETMSEAGPGEFSVEPVKVNTVPILERELCAKR